MGTRTTMLRIRVTEAERKAIMEAAAAAGKTVSQLVRDQWPPAPAATQQRAIVVRVPDGWKFSSLGVRRRPETGEIEFDLEALRQCLPVAGDLEWLMSSQEDNVAEVLLALYRATGGEEPAFEALISEVLDEEGEACT